MTRTSRRGFVRGLATGASLSLLGGFTEEALAAPPEDPGPGRGPDDEAYWRWLTREFLTQPEIAYMNTGTRGPSPRSVVRAQVDAIRAYDSDRLSYARYVEDNAHRDLLRARLAAFVGAGPGELAMTNNTTEGMAFGTLGVDLRRGDEIVCTNHDHSSGAQPVNLRAAREGIAVKVLDLSDARFHPPASPGDLVDAFDRVIGPRTRLISFCHINYTDGCMLPVREICELARSRNVMTLVDGAHPPGMIDLDIDALGCDMYAGACHKWMLASMLTGFFYVREDAQDRVWPTVYSGPVNGRNMYGQKVEGETARRTATAARYEMHGSRHYAAAASVEAALAFHERVTPQAIEARDRYLAGRARAGLRGIPGVTVYAGDDPSLSCGIVAFRVHGVDPVELNELLWTRHGIYIRNVTHPEIGWDVNRVSLHIMVHAAQVDALVGGVAEIARERGV